jgi:hypothetical protein
MRVIPFSTNQSSEGTTLWVLTCFEHCSFAGVEVFPMVWIGWRVVTIPPRNPFVWLVVKPFFALQRF